MENLEKFYGINDLLNHNYLTRHMTNVSNLGAIEKGLIDLAGVKLPEIEMNLIGTPTMFADSTIDYSSIQDVYGYYQAMKLQMNQTLEQGYGKAM